MQQPGLRPSTPFDPQGKEPRLFVLHALARAAEKFGARMDAVAVMSNHVHDLIEPRGPDELPRVMHWLNWYTARIVTDLPGETPIDWDEMRCSGTTSTLRWRPSVRARSPVECTSVVV